MALKAVKIVNRHKKAKVYVESVKRPITTD